MNVKKIVASIAQSMIAVSAGLNAVGSAVLAEATSPTVYVDITYETSTRIRADIIFENFPDFHHGGFLVRFDDGWEPALNVFNEPDYTTQNCMTNYSNLLYVTQSSVDPQLCGVAFVQTANYAFNGRFISLYFNKTENYSASNSNIYVAFENGAVITNSNGVNIVSSNDPDSYVAPEITQTSEYMIGDLDGDNHVDATDASAVLYGLSVAGVDNISPRAIENTYHNYFPDALAPAAPDADKSGLINSDDATAIMHYYGSAMTNTDYEGQIGSMDVYEYYNN